MARRTVSAALAGSTAVLTLAACGGGGGSQAAAGSADGYPSKTVRMVVPYPAGGGLDIAARAVAPCLEKDLGKNVIVENKAGGSGAVGTTDVLGKPADGHTLEMVLTSSAVITPLSNEVGYKLADLQPVGQVAEFPYVVIVGKGSPHQSLEDLLTSSDSLKAAAPGASSQGAVELEALKRAGAPITLVPFDGTAGVKTALLGKQVDFGTAVVDDDILKQHAAGTLRILGVTSGDRVDYLPDTPAVKEISGFESLGAGMSYFGIVVKKGTPANVMTKLSGALQGCLKDSATRGQIGDEFVGDTFVDGAQLTKAFEAQSEAYAPIVNKS
ncbi:tripartite tricarboxylate transporter substrate binding protein [Knoellia locipacati]|uniref:tripartite tricarboxylate transporter substrate binding protein n=1 Tax=Knoellia locipacati TaxID=882824 RepID=UPI0038510DE8